MFQYFINVTKREGEQMFQVRVDEDRILAKLHELSKLLLEIIFNCKLLLGMHQS